MSNFTSKFADRKIGPKIFETINQNFEYMLSFANSLSARALYSFPSSNSNCMYSEEN